MADDKTLQIKLAATGGDAAAKEVEKVEDALADLGQQAQGATTPSMEALFAEMPAWGTKSKDLATAGEDIASGWGKVPVQLSTTSRLAAELRGRQQQLTGSTTGLQSAVDDLSGSSGSGGLAGLIGESGNVLGAFRKITGALGIFTAAFQVGWQAVKKLTEHLAEVEAAANRALPDLARTSQAAAIEQANLAAAAAEVADQIARSERAFDAYAKRLRQVAQESQAVTDAELGADLAEIDLAELQGNLTEAEAIQARFDAQRAAAARKRATEIAAIEEELKNRTENNRFALEDFQDFTSPVNEARGRVDQLNQGGASGSAELSDLRDARNAANAARANATTTDPAELDALDKAITDTQEALAKAFADLVADAIKKRDDLIAAADEAAARVRDGNADQARLERELAGQTTGAGSSTFAAGERAAEARRQAELLRLEQAVAADKAKADAAVAAANAKNTDRGAIDIAKGIESSIAAAPNAGGNPELIAALQGIAATLGNGTDQGELAGVTQTLVTLLGGLSADQSSAKAVIEGLKSQVANLTARINQP